MNSAVSLVREPERIVHFFCHALAVARHNAATRTCTCYIDDLVTGLLASIILLSAYFSFLCLLFGGGRSLGLGVGLPLVPCSVIFSCTRTCTLLHRYVRGRIQEFAQRVQHWKRERSQQLAIPIRDHAPRKCDLRTRDAQLLLSVYAASQLQCTSLPVSASTLSRHLLGTSSS